MKKTFTYILLAFLTLLPMTMKAGKIDWGRIQSVKLEGDFNGWNSANDTWYYNEVANTSKNQWSNTFYVKTSDLTSTDGDGNKQAYFKLRIGDEWNNTYEFGYNNDDDASFPAINTEASWNNIGKTGTQESNYVDKASGGGAMRLHFVNTSSGYVRLYTNFWGSTEEGGAGWNTRVTFTQSAVEPLTASLSADATTLTSGGTTTLHPSATGGSGDYKYEYTTTEGSIENGMFTAPTVTGETTVTITVTAKDAHSQLAGLTVATNTLTIIIKPGAVASTAVTGLAEIAKLKKGGTVTLSAEANGTNKAVTWSSDATDVATVDAAGVVTAKAKGTATITATAADGSGAKASCAVTVLEKYTFTINLYDNKNWGEAYKYIFGSLDQNNGWPGNSNAAPADRVTTAEDGLKWWSFDFTDIDENAKYILTCGGGYENVGEKKTADILVSETHTTGNYYMVTEDGEQKGKLLPFTPVTDVSLDEIALTLKKDATVTLTAIVAPIDATLKEDITWTTSDDKVATVSNGKVTAIAPGIATITVTTKNNSKTATCTVTVLSTAITGVDESLSLLENGTHTFTASANGPDASIIWTSSDAKVVTVANGVVTANGLGTATITAKASDNEEVVATCKVRVCYPTFTLRFWVKDWAATSVYTFDADNQFINASWPGESATRESEDNNWWTYTFKDYTIGDSFIFNNNNNGSQTVDIPIDTNHEDGEYTLGEKDGEGKYAFVPFVHTTSVTLDQNMVAINPFASLQLTATVNGTNTKVIWTSSDETIATVDQTGKVTAKDRGGVIVIRATSQDDNTVYAECEVAIQARTIAVYFDMTDADMGDNIEVHYWCDGYDKWTPAILLTIPHATTTQWYMAEIPVLTVDNATVSLQIHKKGESGDASYSVDKTISDDQAYIVGVSDGKHPLTESDELTTVRSFVYSQKDGDSYYSNRIEGNGTVSYYVTTDHEDYGFYQGNDILGYTKQELTAMENNVHVVTVKDGQPSNPAVYTGNYYLRADISTAGKWEDFSILTDEQKTDALFTFYGNEETGAYYWVKFVESGDVTAAVGNPYNNELTTIGADALINEDGTLPVHANVRYEYNPTTNTLVRAMIDGSSDGTGFLTIYTATSGKLYTTIDGDVEVTKDKRMSFLDASGWVYDATVYAEDKATATIIAKYNGKEQALFGIDENGKPIERQLRNDGRKERYGMRVIYDFKTNQIIDGWEISDKHITENMTVASNVIITREMNRQASQVTFADGASLTIEGKRIYTILQITKEEYNDNGGFIWISLPYDCYVKDVYGIQKYGERWTIQRYRGDKRAEETWNVHSPSFWRNMNNKSETAKMEAGRGYVVWLNLNEKEDFKDVEINGKLESVVRLYFPSAATTHTFSNTATYTAPEHECEVETRRYDDSHWNVIGVTGLQDMIRMAGDGALSGFYTWSWNNDRGHYAPADITDETVFESTKAYMVQYAGTIDWKQAVTKSSSGLTPRRAPEATLAYNMQLHFTDGKDSVRTFIKLNEQATKDYDLNRDMGMIINEGIPQVYSLTGASQLAINYLPIESQTVAIGLQAPAAGEYTFSMPSVPAGVIPTLYDSKTGATINLAFDKYTVSLEQGTDEKRFVLQLNVQNTPTGCEDLTVQDTYRITQVGNSLLISGLTEPADIRLYDALGRMLYEGSVQYEAIPVTQTGVYLLSINGNVQRILIK